MATTGSTSLRDAASKLGNHPEVPEWVLRRLELADALLPYVFDAVESYTADATNYPGGKTMTSLDGALLIVGGLLSYPR